MRERMLLKLSVLAALLLAVAGLVPQPTWGWCYLEGFTLGRGKRLYLLKTSGESDCEKACEDVSLCTHWSFDRGRSYCVLRTEDITDKMLIRRQEDAVSGTKDCSLAISLTTGGYSCFSDGWTVSTPAADPSSSQVQRSPSLLHNGTALSAENCQQLCQKSDERCAVWEWDVLTNDCRLYEGQITLHRSNDLPLGFSVYTSPEGEPEDASARSYPWIVATRISVGKNSIKLPLLDASFYDGQVDGGHIRTYINSPNAPNEPFQRAQNSMVQIYQRALEAKKLTGFFVGVDSKTPAVKAITDRVSSPEACQTLCKSTKSCEMFTFYIDGRSGANCVLKTAILINEAFIHPVAVTGSTTTTTALGLRGMKFGYEMRSSTIVTPKNPIDPTVGFVYEQMFQMTAKVDAMAKEACTLLGAKGYAVIDYISQSAHAVPASDAKEAFMPNFNYIDCSKVK